MDVGTESRYRAIVEMLSEMICLARVDGTIVYANLAYARQFGAAPGELIGANLFDHVAARDREAVRRLMTQVMATGTTIHSENRIVAKDGSECWASWTNSVHRESDEWLMQSVGRDITARRRAESALRSSQAFLERIGRVAGVGGWEIDLVNGTILWSDETRRIHEVGDDHVPTLENGLDFYTPEARPMIDSAIQRSIQFGEAWDLEVPFVTAKGRLLWVRTSGEAQFEQGKAVRVLGAFQDITERRRLEQQSIDDRRFLRQLANSLPVRIAYLDTDRRYRFVNTELLRHLERTHDEVIGRTRVELRPDRDDLVFVERARAALAGRTQRFEYEERVGGQLRRIENQLTPDVAEDGEVRGFFVTGIDITDRDRPANIPAKSLPPTPSSGASPLSEPDESP